MNLNSLITFFSKPIIIGIIFLLLHCFIALTPVMGYDEGLWNYIGWLFNTQGIPPYVGAIENKTPGIFFLFAIFNNFGEYSIWIIRFIGVFFSLGTLSIIYKIGKEYFNVNIAVISVYTFGLVSSWLRLDGFIFSQTETFMIFFNCLAFYLLLNLNKDGITFKGLMLLGLCIGMALNFKQIALTSAISFFIILLTINNSATRFIKLSFIVCVGILTSLFIAYFVLLFYGVSFKEYIDGSWKILLNSGSKASGVEIHIINFFATFLKTRLLLFIPIFILFFYTKSTIGKRLWLFLLVWFTFDFIGANASGNYYGHQLKQFLPAISLITGVVITHLFSNQFILKKHQFLTTIVLLGLAMPLRQIKNSSINILEYPNEKQERINNIVKLIKSKTNSSNYIYLFGADTELVFVQSKVNLKSASKYFHSIFVKTDKERNKIFNDLITNNPVIILKHRDYNSISDVYGQKINQFFMNNYELSNTVDEIEIYSKI